MQLAVNGTVHEIDVDPGMPPAAPALANAIFDLTSERFRSLPLRNHIDFI